MRAKALVVAALAVLLLAVPASAATIVWDFGTFPPLNTQVPSPVSFTSGGFTLVADGISPNTSATPPFTGPPGAIFIKNLPGDERGLGVCVGNAASGNACGVNNEIDQIPPRDILRIDRDNLPLTNWQFMMGSVQSETWHVWTSNDGTCTVCTNLGTGTDELFHPIPSNPNTQRFLFFGSDVGDTLLVQITASTVPEPSSLMLLGMGVSGLAVILRGRRKATKA